MTNEEAIKLIDDRMCFGRGRWSEHHRPVIDEYWQAGEMAIKALEQPKTGKWISADAIFGGEPFYCSECGENTRDTVMGKPRWNFCPNCGADMRGEQDE